MTEKALIYKPLVSTEITKIFLFFQVGHGVSHIYENVWSRNNNSNNNNDKLCINYAYVYTYT